MIPNSPIWAYVNATPLVYVDYEIAIPKYRPNIFGLSIGPKILGDSNNKVNERYWLVEQDGVNGDVFISGSVGDNWGNKVFLFNEPKKISEIALTFDQLGSAIIPYCVIEDSADGQGLVTRVSNVYLNYYDPLAETLVTKHIAEGANPLGGFDYPNDTSNSMSDALLFYKRDSIICMRIQREKFEIEYQELIKDDNSDPVIGLRLLSSGKVVDKKFQVVYEYKNTIYTPPDPIPPIVVPATGYWKYKLTGFGSRISIEHNFWFNTKDDLSVSFIADEVVLNRDDIVIFSQCFATHFVEQGSSQGRYGAHLLAIVGGVDHKVLTLIVGGYKTELSLPVALQPGSWSFVLSNGLMSISFTSLDGANTVMLDNLSYAIGQSLETAYPLVFGGDGSINPKNSFQGVMREMRASSMGRDIYCPGDEHDVIDGSYLPVYNADRSVLLYNARSQGDHRNQNWIFQKT